MIQTDFPHRTLFCPVLAAEFYFHNTFAKRFFIMSAPFDKTNIDNDAKATDTLLQTLRGYHSKIDDEETRHTVIRALSKVIEDLEEPFDLLMRLANSVCHMDHSLQTKANNQYAGRHDATDQSWLSARRLQDPI